MPARAGGVAAVFWYPPAFVTQPRKRSSPRPYPLEAQIRRGTVRIPIEIARRVSAGHPFLFREALGSRPLRERAGAVLDTVDVEGGFVARGIYDPEGAIAVRVFTRDRQEAIDGAAFERRVLTARRLRERLLAGERSTAYRLVHGEGDGLPGITVDRYGDYLVAHLYSASLLDYRGFLYDALEAVYAPRGIYEQHRFRPLAGAPPRHAATLERGEPAPVELEVEEGGLVFLVDVTAPLGTGLFPDLREGRRAVAARASGRRVLNLFSYTGAFSVYAASAGATRVVSVDLAQKAHARARRNLERNRISEAAHEFIAGDTFKVLAKLAARRHAFDLIILDPPSFAQAKGRVFTAQKDYRELVDAALEVAAPGALMACISSTHKLSAEELDRAIGDAAGRARRQMRVVERRGLPSDFPVPAGFFDGHYLKFFFCAVD